MGKSRKKKRRERDLEERPSRFSAGSSSRTFPSSEIESAPKGLETGIKEPEASDGKRRVRYIRREERKGVAGLDSGPTRRGPEREREGHGYL